MEILSLLVPAVRETRIPLIVGYAWLLAGWLALSSVAEELLESVSEEGTILWMFSKAFSVVGPLGSGIAITVVAVLVGGADGYVWETVFPSLDERAIRDRASRLFSESNLRLRLLPPTTLSVLLLDLKLANPVAMLILFGGFALLVYQGMATRFSALSLPVKVDLAEADLSSAYLRCANFTNTDLKGANLQGANLKRAILISTDLDGAKTNDVNLARVDFTKVRNLQYSHLEDAKDLSDANLPEAHMNGINLSEGLLVGANLKGAQLVGANLSGANLKGAQLDGANLSGATLDGAILTNASFSRIRIYRYIPSSISFPIAKTYSWVPNRILSRIFTSFLTNVDLTDVDLTNVDLTNVDLTNVDLTNVDLTEVDLTGPTTKTGKAWAKFKA